MSLYVPDPPNDGIQIISAGLSRLMRHPYSCVYATMSAIPTDELTAALPHQIYFIGVNDLVAGRLVVATVLSGWRYIILRHNRPLIVAELTRTPDGQQFEFSHAGECAFVMGTLRGIRKAEELKKIEKEDFEVRVLEVPSLNVVSLWLHSETEDLFMPVSPAPKPLIAYKIYSENAFRDALSEPAGKRFLVNGARA